eukprot:Seg851.1 transcript_id=Seg851.1/GoldUCD/mRNA.D3Y31 product="FH protein interacting protein FIP2" protein_id=Seg851.1/GoldUCD/D3Y31
MTTAYAMLEEDLKMIDTKFHDLIKMQDKLKDSYVEVEDVVKLNVGGHYFETSLQTLKRQPNTFFTAMFSGCTELSKGKDGAYFVDQDGTHFRHILNYLRKGTIPSVVVDQIGQELIPEAEFYGITSLVDILLGIPSTTKDDDSKLYGGKDSGGNIQEHSLQAHFNAEKACREVTDAYKAMENEIKNLEMIGKKTEEVAKLLKNPDESVKLNVGGVIFQTSHSTLLKEPGSVLAAIVTGGYEVAKHKDGCYFIDRDATRFKHILNYLRDGEIPTKVVKEMGEGLHAEAKFFGIRSLASVLKAASLDLDVHLINNKDDQLNDMTNKIFAKIVEESIKVKIKVDSTERKILKHVDETCNKLTEESDALKDSLKESKADLKSVAFDYSELKKEVNETNVKFQGKLAEAKDETIVLKSSLNESKADFYKMALNYSEMKKEVNETSLKLERKLAESKDEHNILTEKVKVNEEKIVTIANTNSCIREEMVAVSEKNKASLDKVVVDYHELKEEVNETNLKLAEATNGNNALTQRLNATEDAMVNANADMKKKVDANSTKIDNIAKESKETKAEVEHAVVATAKHNSAQETLNFLHKGLEYELKVHGNLALDFFCGLAQSHILKGMGDISRQALDSWLLETNNKGVVKLIYHSTGDVDEFDFHRDCDGIYPTLTLVRSNHDCVFGGFTTRYWSRCSGKLYYYQTT